MTEKSVVPKEKLPDMITKKGAKKKKVSKEKKMTIQMELRVNLTEKEILSHSRNLAKVNQDLAIEENAKKEVMLDFANKMNMLKSNISLLSQKISNGYEYRGVDVDVVFDYKKGLKIYIRRDTKETVEEKPMTDGDRQQEFKFKDKKDKKANEKKPEKKAAEEKKDTKEKQGKKEEKPANGKKGKKDGWGNEAK